MPSVMSRVAVPNARHNKDEKYRAQLENVDPTLTKYNEVIREKSVEQIYEEHLQPAYDEYNNRQKRKDRRYDVKYGCKTALEYQRLMDVKARNSKNNIDQKGRPPLRELVLQYGNPKQGFGCKDATPESRAFAKMLLLEAQMEIEEAYPQLLFGDILFHTDEVSKDAEDELHGSHHLHTSFVPVCFLNKQGLSVQVAFERCLKEMGFDTFEDWKHDVDRIMEDVLKRHGLERTYMDNHEEHQDSSEYHRQQRAKRRTKELEKENQVLESKIIGLEGKIKELRYDKDVLEEKVKELEDEKQDLRSAIKTTIKSKEEYDEAVAEIKDKHKGFLNVVLDCFYRLRQAYNDPSESVWKVACEEFDKTVAVLEDKLFNLLGYEKLTSMDKEKQETQKIEQLIDVASLVSEAENLKNSKNSDKEVDFNLKKQ